VLYWAFQAGAISRRFLWNVQGDRDGKDFYPLFSKCGWVSVLKYEFQGLDKPHKLLHDVYGKGKYNIPRGQTVYFVQANKVFGHVVLSLGNGMCISQNIVNTMEKDKADLVTEQERPAVVRMNTAITHIFSIKRFTELVFYPSNGYKELQYTQHSFWEDFAGKER
jgi:hypothetical protein